MALHRLLPRNGVGAPRRLRGHGEAIRWAFGSLARLDLRLLPYYFLGIVGQFAVRLFLYSDGSPGLTSLVSLALVVPLALWLLISPILYLYVVVSGGVMSHNERRRDSPGR